jgi:DNA-binding NtrC family response regulator
MLKIPNVLFLCCEEKGRADDGFLCCRESVEVRGVLGEHAALTCVCSLTELEQQSHRRQYDLLLCGWSFHQGQWKDAVGAVRSIAGNLPVVFLSPSDNASQWREVFEAGGFDLLVSPCSKYQTRAVVEQAMESRQACRCR